MSAMVYVYVLIIAVTATDARVTRRHKVLRVHRGNLDLTSKYPYVVSLMPIGNGVVGEFVLRICTGSLINANWVLTAAHCVTSLVRYIQYGNMSVPLSLTDTRSAVQKWIRHPQYFEIAARNDIGLLFVTSVSMDKYGKLSAVDFKTLPGQAVDYAGFGRTFISKRKTRNKLVNFVLDFMRPLQLGEGIVKSCNDEAFTKNLICISSKCSSNQFILPGDSGGPLIYDDKIAGVACAITLDYSEQSFTPISPHLTWIQTVISSKPAYFNKI